MSGVYNQLENARVKHYKDLTVEDLDKFFEELRIMEPQESCGWIKENNMSKKRKTSSKELNEELIKSVFEMYTPNKVQLFIMKKFGLDSVLTGNKTRVNILSNVLSMDKDKVLELEKKYYLG